MEEDDEHMFFFAWTDEVFTSPAGDGNVDNRDDPVNYNDFDENNLPLGLSTDWETECVEENASGSFRIILKHQPGVKSETSTVDDGGTDLDLTFTVNVANDPEAPPCENEEEIITDVTLTFTPVNGGDPIVARAQDPDGEGPLDLEILDDINLGESTEYTLSVDLRNEIEGESITEEIMEEDDEHMFFFAWTDGIFSDPMGDGNVDNRDDPVNYNDFDENNLPVGLSTTWTTSDLMADGTFRIILKHQPDIKSGASTVDDGGTDLDLTFNIGAGTTSTGTVVRDRRELQIAPNPVRARLNWQIEGVNSGDTELVIFNQLGSMLRTIQSPDPNLDVSNLPVGTYLLMVREQDNVWMRRFVKVR